MLKTPIKFICLLLIVQLACGPSVAYALRTESEREAAGLEDLANKLKEFALTTGLVRQPTSSPNISSPAARATTGASAAGLEGQGFETLYLVGGNDQLHALFQRKSIEKWRPEVNVILVNDPREIPQELSPQKDALIVFLPD